MKCDQARALIGSATDNELANGEAALVADHIGDCAQCRDQWDKILRVRQGITDISRAQEPNADFEKRLIAGVYRQERKKSRASFNWAVVGIAALALISMGAVSYFNIEKSKNTNQSVATTQPGLNKKASTESVEVEGLVLSVGHHSSGQESPAYKVQYKGKGNPSGFSAEAGFKIKAANLTNYVLEGSDIVKTSNHKTLVRMCYTSLTKGETDCIDCYQAPSGMLSFAKTSTREIVMANGQTARFGEVDGQSAVMVSNQGLDTLYVSPIAAKKLLQLVAPNA